jgi:hypothetical protein
MFTNGDNSYNSAWFDSIATQILNENNEFIVEDLAELKHKGVSISHTGVSILPLPLSIHDTNSTAASSLSYNRSPLIF